MYDNIAMKLITPSDLKMNYADFRDICAEKLEESANEWKNEKFENRDRYIKAWVNISPYLITEGYINGLKRELEEVGWQDVDIRYINDNYNTEKLFIAISF